MARPYQLSYAMQEQQLMLPFKSCYDDVLPVQQSVQSLTGAVAALALVTAVGVVGNRLCQLLMFKCFGQLQVK